MNHKVVEVNLDIEDIGRIAAYQNLDASVRQNILAGTKGLKVQANQEILAYQEQGDDVYFILEGQVRVNMISASGRQITYQLLETGDMFGELAAIDGLPRSASVIAESDVVLAEMPGKQFMELAELHPKLALIIMQRLANLSRWLTSRVFEYHAYNVKGRIYLELIRMNGSQVNKSILLQLSDRDMASRVGTTRENVTRIYSGLKKSGILQRDSTGIKVLDENALKGLLDECEFS